VGCPGGQPDQCRYRAPERMMGVTYDTGALLAADRGERRMRARHRALLSDRSPRVRHHEDS